MKINLQLRLEKQVLQHKKQVVTGGCYLLIIIAKQISPYNACMASFQFAY